MKNFKINRKALLIATFGGMVLGFSDISKADTKFLKTCGSYTLAISSVAFGINLGKFDEELDETNEQKEEKVNKKTK